MTEKQVQWLAVAVGVALIAIYSIVMMASDGGSGWAWLLLMAGILVLGGGGWLGRRTST